MKPPVPTFRVGKLGDRWPPSQDGLGLVGPHPLAKGGHRVVVFGAAGMGVAASMFDPIGMRYRGRDLAAPLLHLRDVFLRGETPVDRVMVGNLAVTLADACMHRRHLAAVAAIITDLDRDDHSRVAIGGELHVVGWAKSAVAHLHVSRFRIGRAATSLFAAAFLPPLFLLLKFGQFLQRLLDALFLFRGRSFGGRPSTAP